MVSLETPTGLLGTRAIDFTLENIDGRMLSLADVKGPKGLLVAFICNHCPYVKAIANRLAEDAAVLDGLGVGVVAIMPNDTETYPEDDFDRMKDFAAQHGFPFPYVIDRDQSVAKAYGAICTPDFFGYDAKLNLKYRGRLDAAGRNLSTADTPRELVEAMRQVAEIGTAPTDQVPSIGCSIKWRSGA